MKKKPQLAGDTVIPEQLRQMAKKSVEGDKPPVVKRCVVCSQDYTPVDSPKKDEELCWVCRRLKISAWRESDQQMSIQE